VAAGVALSVRVWAQALVLPLRLQVASVPHQARLQVPE
jgi:hypothetical protein